MKYIRSEHYREDPFEEVGAALAAGNSLGSVQSTFEARKLTEEHQVPRDIEALQRIEQQLTYLGSLAVAQELQVA